MTNFSFPISKRFDNLTLQRLVRKSVIDRAVTVAKVILIVGCIILALLLVVEISSSRARLTTAIMELQNGVKSENAPSPVSPAAEKPDYQILVKQPLLGQIDNGAPKAGPAATPKPISTIALILAGTYLEKGHEPYAIIEDKKKTTQEVFNIGDLIFGEATLKAILADRVEIERNGQTEQLILDDLHDGKSDSKGGISSDNTQFTVEEGELDKALENLPLLLTQARAVPYFKEGVSVGLRLFAIKSDSIFEKIGLKNGDILKSVNGNSLGDITQAMKLFETLKQERSLSLKLERNLEEKEFKYEIK